MRVLPFFKKIDQVNRLVGISLAWLALLMTLVGVYNAVTRKLGHVLGVELSSNLYLEMQWYFFGIILLLGGSYALRERVHVRVDVIYAKLSLRNQVWVDTIGHVIFLIPLCVLIIWVSAPWVWQSISILEASPDPDGLPRYIIKAMIPLGFFLLLLQGLSELSFDVAFLRGLISEKDRETHSIPQQATGGSKR